MLEAFPTATAEAPTLVSLGDKDIAGAAPRDKYAAAADRLTIPLVRGRVPALEVRYFFSN